jgi:hypothetical protein
MEKKNLFRGYNLFEEFVFKYHTMPSLDELVIFFFIKTKNSQNHKFDTLPYMSE